MSKKNDKYADISLLGYATDSGKGHEPSLDILTYTDCPYFRGVIFRRMLEDITKTGGLWNEAKDLWEQSGAIFKEETLTVIFPSGAQIKFSHMEKESDRYDWAGLELTFIGFDGAEDFEESQILFMISRLRTQGKYSPFMRLTYNT